MSNEPNGAEVSRASEPETNIVSRIFCRTDCKYCFGRGYERWLANRTTRPDGSKHESFLDRPCRNARMAQERYCV